MPVIQVSLVSKFVVSCPVSRLAALLAPSTIGGHLRKADAGRDLHHAGAELGVWKCHDAEGDLALRHRLAVYTHCRFGHRKSRPIMDEARGNRQYLPRRHEGPQLGVSD